jgi:hypothetical protein
MLKMKRYAISVSLRQFFRVVLLTGCSTAAAICSIPLRAAAPDTPPSEAADKFLVQLDPTVTAGAQFEPEVSISNPGYVYVEVEKIGSAIGESLLGAQCQNAFLKTGRNQNAAARARNLQFNDILFRNSYELGLALRIPMQLQVGDTAVPAEVARIELPIFGLTRGGKKRCNFRPGRLDRQPFKTPYIPIPTNVAYDSQKAVIELVPWAVKTPDDTRVNAFWTGLGTAASLLGPIGVLGKQLFDTKNEKLTLGTQGKSAVESWLNLTDSGASTTRFGEGTVAAARTWTRTVSPVGTAAAPQWNYSLRIRGMERDKDEIGFTARIRYRRSRIFEGISAESFATAQSTVFENFLTFKSDIEGKKWGEISPVIIDLGKTDNPTAFGTLCNTAYGDLHRLGFSDGDSAFLIYAIARSKFSADKIGKVNCLGLKPLPKLAETLQTYQIPAPIVRLDSTDSEDWQIVFEAARKSLRTPGESDLKNLLGPSVIISGNPKLLVASDGAKWLDGVTLNSLSVETLKSQLSQLKAGGVASCTVDVIGDNKPFNLPISAGGEAAERSLAFMLDQQTSATLIFLGLSGKTSGVEGKPQISHIWIGQPSDIDEKEEEEMEAVLDKMRSMLGNAGKFPCKSVRVSNLLTVASPASVVQESKKETPEQ